MKQAPDELLRTYTAALRDFLQHAGDESALLKAYEAGREGVDAGLGVLDMVAVHMQALDLALGESATLEEALNKSMASAGLLLETLGPFEMAYRGFREANEKLSSLAESLEQQVSDRTAELQTTARRLRRIDRERVKLLESLVSTAEEERRRIAVDIHDDAIQKMSAVAMRLDMLLTDHRELQDDEGLSKLNQTVTTSIDSLRHLLFELSPPGLESGGLLEALRLYLDQQSKFDGAPEYNIEHSLQTEPPLQTRLVLYRIAQEALTNAKKHARATLVTVLVADRTGGHFVRVQDDGVGFVLKQRIDPLPGHLGLLAMRQRAEMAGGEFLISSAPGEGTTVESWLPSHHEGTEPSYPSVPRAAGGDG
jgi:signal transduction histidine kinase